MEKIRFFRKKEKQKKIRRAPVCSNASDDHKIEYTSYWNWNENTARGVKSLFRAFLRIGVMKAVMNPRWRRREGKKEGLGGKR